MLCFSLFDTPRDFVHVDSFGEVVQMIEGRFTFAKKERRKYRTVLIDKEDPLCRSGWAETYKVVLEGDELELPMGYCNFSKESAPRFSPDLVLVVLGGIVAVLTAVHSVITGRYDTSAWCLVAVVLYYVIWYLKKMCITLKLRYLMK